MPFKFFFPFIVFIIAVLFMYRVDCSLRAGNKILENTTALACYETICLVLFSMTVPKCTIFSLTAFHRALEKVVSP